MYFVVPRPHIRSLAVRACDCVGETELKRGRAGMPYHYPRNQAPLDRVFGLCSACGCDSGLKGRFPVAQGAALGLEPPKKLVFRPEGPISRRVLFSPSCTGFQVLTSLALLKPVLQAWWAGDVWAVAGACFVCTVPAFASQARNAVFRKGS